MTSTRLAKFVLVASSLLLLATGAVWAFADVGGPRADLVGAGVRQSTQTPSTRAPQIDRDSPRTTFGPSDSPRPALPAPPRTAVPPTSSLPAIPFSFPTRIAIPSLEVDAEIVAVGLEPDGSMEIPPAEVAGWYHYGPKPGAETGSAVIAGHVASQGLPGVFLKLRSLPVGDEVTVTDADGRTHRYVVSERFQVGKGQLPSAELFRTSGEPVLTLITCGGEFDRKSRRYSDNVIIRATAFAPSAKPSTTSSSTTSPSTTSDLSKTAS
jgi:LPXTG-site transpeptidase (sortase) family protein